MELKRRLRRMTTRMTRTRQASMFFPPLRWPRMLNSLVLMLLKSMVAALWLLLLLLLACSLGLRLLAG